MNEDKDEIKKYYSSGIEKDRLETEYFLLEGIRTKQIISRYLDGPRVVLDIGGGAGHYALWLASEGHSVTLLDLSEDNVTLARRTAQERNLNLKEVLQGDATQLPYADKSFTMALLLGPLYHLDDRSDRVKALRETKRILKPGSPLICAVISRYASLMDGFQRDLVMDDEFMKILVNDLRTGHHINVTKNPEYFTRAYFHSIDELKSEIAEAGLTLEKLIAVEGFGWIVPGLIEKLKDEKYRRNLMATLEMVESNEDLISMSPHIIAVARA